MQDWIVGEFDDGPTCPMEKCYMRSRCGMVYMFDKCERYRMIQSVDSHGYRFSQNENASKYPVPEGIKNRW